ncbi:hypothetical protein GOP47_0000686, partial [Adiantum capillus-veneris]
MLTSSCCLKSMMGELQLKFKAGESSSMMEANSEALVCKANSSQKFDKETGPIKPQVACLSLCGH